MGNSWLLAGATAGMHVRIGAPEGYDRRRTMFERARRSPTGPAAPSMLVTDPRTAVDGADVVVTDTWMSMGKEDEAEARAEIFAPYQVTTELLHAPRPTRSSCTACPPTAARRSHAEVIDGPQSVVWDEAENRRHAQKAILIFLLERRR